MSIPKQLCLYCQHFDWEEEYVWGHGSTLTGPMTGGGDANCAKGVFSYERPSDAAAWRKLIFHGANCKHYAERTE